MSETLLGFDVGARRVGVAVGNDLLRHAQPAGIVTITEHDDGFATIERLVREWQPQRLVVGMPFELDDKSRGQTVSRRRCDAFAGKLAQRFALPVERVDERYSSLAADELHRERRQAGITRRAKALDDLAAQVILQRYLDELPAREAAS